MKEFLNRFRSVFKNDRTDQSDFMKFDEAELSAESAAVIKDMLHSMKNPKKIEEEILLLDAFEEPKIETPQSLKEKIFSSVHTSVELSRGPQKAGKRIITNSIITVPKHEKGTPIRNKYEGEIKE